MYAGWGFSQAFYWDHLYRSLGYSSLEDFLVGFWEGFFLDGRDANNLLTMLWTWQNADVGLTPGFDGDTVAALRSIRARALVMPAEKDLYFPPEDEEWAVRHIPDAELRVIPVSGVTSPGTAATRTTPASSTRPYANCSPRDAGRPAREQGGRGPRRTRSHRPAGPARRRRAVIPRPGRGMRRGCGRRPGRG